MQRAILKRFRTRSRDVPTGRKLFNFNSISVQSRRGHASNVSTMNLPEQSASSVAAFSSSFRAWFKSAVISWCVLCLVMSGLAFIVAGERLGLMNWLWLLTLSSMFHVGTYSLIGIPFFAVFWPRSQSCVWRIKFSLPIGAFLGFIGMWLGFAVLVGRPVNMLDRDFAGSGLIGAAYGIVTATVAWRLKNADQESMRRQQGGDLPGVMHSKLP